MATTQSQGQPPLSPVQEQQSQDLLVEPIATAALPPVGLPILGPPPKKLFGEPTAHATKLQEALRDLVRERLQEWTGGGVGEDHHFAMQLVRLAQGQISQIAPHGATESAVEDGILLRDGSMPQAVKNAIVSCIRRIDGDELHFWSH